MSQESKDLGIENIKQAQDKISDLKVFGDGDTWVFLCKASSEKQGFMKSTKVMNVPGGCLIQVTTQQRNVGVAEGLTFVPHVRIDNNVAGKPILVPHPPAIFDSPGQPGPSE